MGEHVEVEESEEFDELDEHINCALFKSNIDCLASHDGLYSASVSWADDCWCGFSCGGKGGGLVARTVVF